MKTISLKMADSIVEKIDGHLLDHHFSTRTEFIREAIRDKLEVLENNRFEAEIRRVFREKGSNFFKKDMDKAELDVFEELERRFGKKE